MKRELNQNELTEIRDYIKSLEEVITNQTELNLYDYKDKECEKALINLWRKVGKFPYALETTTKIKAFEEKVIE